MIELNGAQCQADENMFKKGIRDLVTSKDPAQAVAGLKEMRQAVGGAVSDCGLSGKCAASVKALTPLIDALIATIEHKPINMQKARQ